MIQFSSFAEFVQMGTHGIYVWSAYGVTLIVLAVNVVAPVLRRRELMREIKRDLAREVSRNESSS